MQKKKSVQMRKVLSKHGPSLKPLPRGVRELDKINFIDLYNMHAESKYDLDVKTAVGVLKADKLKEMFSFVRYEPSRH